MIREIKLSKIIQDILNNIEPGASRGPAPSTPWQFHCFAYNSFSLKYHQFMNNCLQQLFDHFSCFAFLRDLTKVSSSTHHHHHYHHHHHRPGQGLLTPPASPSDPLHQDLWLRLARKKYYSMNIISNHHKGMRRHLNVDDEIEGETWVPSACEHLEPPEKLRNRQYFLRHQR